jgi:hypothetical protein
MKYCWNMHWNERLRTLGKNIVHGRFTNGQILEAAMITAQGLRSRLAGLEVLENPEKTDVAYLGSRLKELRELTRQLNHDDENSRVRQLVHMRHMLAKRVRKLVEKCGMQPGMIMPADNDETTEEKGT